VHVLVAGEASVAIVAIRGCSVTEFLRHDRTRVGPRLFIDVSGARNGCESNA
jgi:hypothetical protein